MAYPYQTYRLSNLTKYRHVLFQRVTFVRLIEYLALWESQFSVLSEFTNHEEFQTWLYPVIHVFRFIHERHTND